MKRKLKVAVFNTQPPHLYFGGVERRIVETAKRLADKVETTVYSGTKKGFNKTTVFEGVTYVPCFSTDVLYPLDNWVFNQSLSRKVDSIKADVYEAHTVSGYKFLKAMKKRRTGKPFIQTVHGVLADEYIKSQQTVSPSLRMKLSNVFMRQLAKIEKDASRMANLIVTVSRYSAHKLVELYGVDEAKIRIVPNGVDIQRFKPTEDCEEVKDRFGGGGSKQVVLFVGRLVPRKGLHFLIEAAKIVLEKRRGVMFLVVGDGPLKNHFLSYSTKVGVSKNFIFFGDVDDRTLPSLYSCADLLALPSVQEGQGISILEAQAAAKPVVAFNVSALNEVVKNEETGLLIKPDSSELAKAILQLLSNSSLREEMGRNGREFVQKNFSWDICAKSMFQVYTEAYEGLS
jgi:glycosyltransferase involved in cell wall biosynthesis